MKIRRKKGCGWNKRRKASNNFVLAIENGEIPENYLANILGVSENVLWRMIPSKTHHVKKGKKVIPTKTFKKESLNIKSYIAIKAKDIELNALAKGIDKDNAKSMKIAFKKMLTNKIDECKKALEKVLKKWDDATAKLIKKYSSLSSSLIL